MADDVKIRYEGESAGAVQAAREVNKSLDDVEKKAGGVGSAFSNLGGIVAGAFSVAGGALLTKGIDAAGAFLSDALGEARENADGQAALAQAIAATGAATGVTAQAVNDYAGKMQLLTKFTDDQILAASTALARFEEIGADVFEPAQTAALDLAQTLGIDTVAAAKLVGKALAEPGEGLARLKAAGIVFSEAQEKVIKELYETGDAAGAQKLVLEELNKTIGGTAEAMGTTATGQAEIFSHMIDDIKQSVGDVLLPVLTGAMGKLIEIFRNPDVQAAIQGIVTAVQEGVKFIGEAFTALFANPQFNEGFDAVLGTAMTTFETFKVGLSVAIPAIVELIKDVQFAAEAFFNFLTSGDTADLWDVGEMLGLSPETRTVIVDTFESIRTGIIESMGGLVSWFQTDLQPALGEFGRIFNEDVMPVLQELAGFFNEHVVPALQTFAGAFNEHILPALREFLGLMGLELKDTLATLGSSIVTTVETLGKLTHWLFTEGIPKLKEFAGVINENINTAIKTMDKTWKSIVGTFERAGGFINDTRDALVAAGDYIGNTLQGILEPFQTTVEGIRDAFAGLWDFIKKVVSALAELGGAVPNAAAGVGGALNDAAGAVNDALGGLGGIIPNPFAAPIAAPQGITGGANGRQFNNYGNISVSSNNVDDMLDQIEERLGGRVQARRRNRE